MAEEKTNKPKTQRKPPKKRPLFVALQVLGEDGQPVEFPKDRVNLIIATRDAGSLLEIIDGSNPAHRNAIHKKVDSIE